MAVREMEPLFLTIIDSRIIHAFGPILQSAAQNGLRFWDGGLFIYPHDDGALCIATDGRAMMMALDREARIAVPRCFQLPNAMIEACAPVKPFVAHYPGWQGGLDVPEWMQPSSVLLFSSGAAVLPAMPHPSDVADVENSHTLYSTSTTDNHRVVGLSYWHGSPRFHPQRALSSPADPALGFDLDPTRVAMFGAAMDIFNPPTVTWTPGGPGGSVVFLMADVPDFIGLLMPLKVPERPSWPAFAREIVASCAASSSEERRSEVAEGRP